MQHCRQLRRRASKLASLEVSRIHSPQSPRSSADNSGGPTLRIEALDGAIQGPAPKPRIVPDNLSQNKPFWFTPSQKAGSQKAGSTQGCSRTVPQFSTDRALRRLTSEFGRDPVYSARYGRQRTLYLQLTQDLRSGWESQKNGKEKSPLDTLRYRGGYFPMQYQTRKNKS